jgi:hypothetical protein
MNGSVAIATVCGGVGGDKLPPFLPRVDDDATIAVHG